MPIKGIDHIDLAVRDVDTSRSSSTHAEELEPFVFDPDGLRIEAAYYPPDVVGDGR